MLEHLSENAQERLRSAEHPDHVGNDAENAAIVAADSTADGVIDSSEPILDATAGPLSEERQREAHGITRSMLEQVPGIGPALASRILDRLAGSVKLLGWFWISCLGSFS